VAEGVRALGELGIKKVDSYVLRGFSDDDLELRAEVKRMGVMNERVGACNVRKGSA